MLVIKGWICTQKKKKAKQTNKKKASASDYSLWEWETAGMLWGMRNICGAESGLG